MSGGSKARMEDGCARSISSFNLEASKINWWTWWKESWGYSWLKLTTSCKCNDIIVHNLVEIYTLLYYNALFGFSSNRDSGGLGQDGQDGHEISNTQTSSKDL